MTQTAELPFPKLRIAVADPKVVSEALLGPRYGPRTKLPWVELRGVIPVIPPIVRGKDETREAQLKGWGFAKPALTPTRDPNVRTPAFLVIDNAITGPVLDVWHQGSRISRRLVAGELDGQSVLTQAYVANGRGLVHIENPQGFDLLPKASRVAVLQAALNVRRATATALYEQRYAEKYGPVSIASLEKIFRKILFSKNELTADQLETIHLIEALSDFDLSWVTKPIGELMFDHSQGILELTQDQDKVLNGWMIPGRRR